MLNDLSFLRCAGAALLFFLLSALVFVSVQKVLYKIYNSS